MMNGWEMGHGDMMGSTGVWALLLWLVLLVDLIFLGVWLWQNIKK